MMDQPVRAISAADQEGRIPVYAVWELTLQCNLKCSHCGSRAGIKRPSELDTPEALSLVDELADLGVRELALIGGEAYLRGDWLEIVDRAKSKGIRPVLQTGGYGFSLKLATRARDAGLAAVGVSIDGLEAIHDRVRGVAGSYRAALGALLAAQQAGLATTANTQIHALNWNTLPSIYSSLREARITSWQIQLTVAMGNAVDNDDLLLQPYQLDEIFEILASLSDQCWSDGINLVAGNNIGYFGPYEHLWRGPSRTHEHYDGCHAGMNAIGIEADGTVKGCPSLATDRFAEGNVRTSCLLDIWQRKGSFSLNRTGTSNLWGFCRTCYYAEICRGGCAWTSDSLLGRPGNNPYCHHRVLTLKSKGLRERIEKVEDAKKSSFGTGLFQLIEEPWQATVPRRSS